MSQDKKQPTQKEQRFIELYLQYWNGARAAREAGYPMKSARETAYEILTKPHIKAYMQERIKDLKIDTDEIYARLSAEARSNISDFIEFANEPVLDKNGKFVGEKQVAHVRKDALEQYGHLVKSISPARNGGFKVELYSAQDALQILAKTLGLIKPDTNIGSVNIYMPDNGRNDVASN